MKFDKIHNKGRAQIFKNRYLEYLTRTHPLIIWGLYLPIIIYLPWYASTKSSLSFLTLLFIFLAGVVFWTFFEYIIHRFVFHWISENPRTKRIAYVLHGNHHEFPRDRQRLFMPAAPSLLAASLIFMIMYVILGYIAFAFFRVLF